ncbi:MAG: PhoH family protein [Alkalispirochaetaceae bacterium]
MSLAQSATFVLESQGVLQQICGANDANVALLEELFGARVYTRGNEVYLDSESKEVQRRFARLFSELESHVALGHTPGGDLIRAVYSGILDEDEQQTEFLKNWAIEIPVNGKRVFPKSYRQATFIKGLFENELSFCVGPAGTGKTYLAVAYALRQILTRAKRKLVLTRPVVEAGESLGYLPGDLAQKISPYLKPLYDAMENIVPGEILQRFEENRTIEIAPLAYMRGRSLRDSVIILDEAQNTTREQMKMFLTRLGENTEAIVTGDITQIDLPRSNHSGLLEALRILEGIEEIHFTFFTGKDIVRSNLVRRIIQAYDADRS